jgi:hypothetical protein
MDRRQRTRSSARIYSPIWSGADRRTSRARRRDRDAKAGGGRAEGVGRSRRYGKRELSEPCVELGQRKPRGDLLQVAIEAIFSSPTGYESYAPTFRSKITIRETFWVKVVLRHDKRSQHGFRVKTGYPFNK